MSTRKLIIGLANVIAFSLLISSCNKSPENKLSSPVSSESELIKTIHRYTFRDLNKNGKLDIYEDPRQSIELSIKDLLKQMTLEEKAGMTPPLRAAIFNVRNQKEDMPYDSKDPLYKFGFGLSY
jgi:hypothetical protein